MRISCEVDFERLEVISAFLKEVNRLVDIKVGAETDSEFLEFRGGVSELVEYLNLVIRSDFEEREIGKFDRVLEFLRSLLEFILF